MNGMVRLGASYEKGIGVPTNELKAVELCRRAADACDSAGINRGDEAGGEVTVSQLVPSAPVISVTRCDTLIFGACYDQGSGSGRGLYVW
jgi:TPR repeat protein